MNGFVPQIGTKGIYTLLPPFENVLTPNTHYTCVGIRRLSDIAATGEDPKEVYYTPFGLDQATFINDLNNSVCIISLQQNSGSMIYVPSTYIKGFPEVNGHIYNNVILAISVGALSESIDLTYVKSKIVDTVRENIGINSEVKTVIASPPVVIDNTTHESIEAARRANLGILTTDHAKYLEAVAQRDSAYTKIQLLEEYLKKLKADGII